MEIQIDLDRCLPEQNWLEAERRLMAAVPPTLRERVHASLVNPRIGGRGLRSLLALLATETRPLPKQLPPELIRVYLNDDEAEPLYDCATCGLPLPVRFARRFGHESAPEHVYFTMCPHCGGPVGRFAYWSARSWTDINVTPATA